MDNHWVEKSDKETDEMVSEMWATDPSILIWSFINPIVARPSDEIQVTYSVHLD